ncbi:MAG: S8 family peptidase [Mycobacteriales bacterium]
MKKSMSLAGLVGLVAALIVTTFGGSAAAAPEGQIRGAGGADAVAGSYLVALKDTTALRSRGTSATAHDMAKSHRGSVKFVYQRAMRGFATRMSESDAKQLAADSRVAYVEQDHMLRLAGTQANPPSWGLDRIDQRNLPLDNSYTYPNTASNVHAYIIDTGIRFSHTTFGGRATSGYDAIDGGTADDCNGHGTHVAGTVGGSQYGVAKGVSLVAVRVLDCQGSGTTSQVVAGIDWVTNNAIKPAVANMSLGGSADTALDNAVRNSIASGVTYAIAAGNGNALGVGVDACSTSPARVAEAITVGATDNTDARASFSNYGTCLDIFAPGVNITSSWNTSDTATNTISGTSMATPHVVGVAALKLSTNPGFTPAQVRDALVADATSNKVTNPGSGSPNKLLYVPNGTPGNVVTVNNPGAQTGTVGTAKSLQMTGSSSGGGALTYTATGLPSGLTISSSGLISGTPTTAGTYNTTVTGTDSTGATGSTVFTWTITGAGGGCTSPGQKLGNPGFESGTAPWTASSGVIDNSTGQPARTGSWKAWLNGYGVTHTDTLSQSVAIPAGCSTYTLSFWLRVTTSETTTTVAYDKLTVKLGTSTLATYSNLNANSTYVQKSFNVNGFAGQTVTLNFTGAEDSSLQTSFVIDDTALNVS